MTRINVAHTRSKIAAVMTTVVDTNAYTSGDALGSVWSFPGAIVANGSGVIENVEIIDTAKQKQPLDIFFFDAAPASTVTNNSAVNLSSSDYAKCLGFVQILAANYADFADRSVASLTSPLPFVLSNAAGATPNTTLYAIALTRGTPTYSSGGLLPYITIRKD